MVVSKIWRKIPEKYCLIGTIDTETGKNFPGRKISKNGNYNLQPFKFSGVGKVITFTIVRNGFSLEKKTCAEIPMRNSPYIMAVIELEEGPRLTTEIVDCKMEDVFIGAKVRSVFRKIAEKGKDGVIQYGYKFLLETN